MVGSPKRREIGHGKLAWRGINAVMPSAEEFHTACALYLKLLNLMVQVLWRLSVVLPLR